MRKSCFRVETITFLHFFRAAYLRRGPRTTFADQGPSKTVAFFEFQAKYLGLELETSGLSRGT